jgi:2-(1,2-epoxy-1,2-dihydrophenyl)acetyl-CoA isomerase
MQYIQFNVEGHLARITFNRPEVFNSMHQPMREEIMEALDACAADAQVRVVYITGSGRAFCAGEDLQEIVDPNGPPLTDILRLGYNPIVMKIKELNKPVVCAVNGVAAGAGANIALACDITVATESASFTQAFSKIGLIPDSGGTWSLPRLVGQQRAAALMMLSDKISATEAAQMGMIWRALPDATFVEDSLKIAERLTTLPPIGLALTKQALRGTFERDFAAQLDVEDQLQTIAGMTEDYQEAVRAFLEKRPAVVRGS